MSLIHLTSQFQLIMIVLKNLHPLIDLLQLLEKIMKLSKVTSMHYRGFTSAFIFIFFKGYFFPFFIN